MKLRWDVEKSGEFENKRKHFTDDRSIKVGRKWTQK
jgi:hypothetical protein